MDGMDAVDRVDRGTGLREGRVLCRVHIVHVVHIVRHIARSFASLPAEAREAAGAISLRQGFGLTSSRPFRSSPPNEAGATLQN